MVVGAMRTGLCQELHHCWVYHAQWFPMCIKNGSPPTGHSDNLTQLWELLKLTWASIPVEHFRHLVVSMQQQIEGCSQGKRGCKAIFERYSSCFVFSVYILLHATTVGHREGALHPNHHPQ